MTALIEMFKNTLSILAYFFNPEVREKRDRKRDFNKFKVLEQEYRKALANKNPQEAARIAKQMKDLRAEYKFVNRK